MIKRFTNGSRQVVITANDKTGPFNSRLYVNVSETDIGDATLVAGKFKSLKGAITWAFKQLAR